MLPDPALPLLTQRYCELLRHAGMSPPELLPELIEELHAAVQFDIPMLLLQPDPVFVRDVAGALHRYDFERRRMTGGFWPRYAAEHRCGYQCGGH